MATVALPAEDGHTSGEGEEEEEVADVDDAEILEDLPDDTEVRPRAASRRRIITIALAGNRAYPFQTELYQ